MPLSKIKTNSLATGAITSAVMPAGSVLQVQRLQYTEQLALLQTVLTKLWTT